MIPLNTKDTQGGTMKPHHSSPKTILLISASFAGYNIGSGFATGMEALQFFCSWGRRFAFAGLLIALSVCMLLLICIYITGYEQKFDVPKDIYIHFCGKRFSFFLDSYIYLSMLCVAITMISGAGATINQSSGLPEYFGTILIGVSCVIAALLGFEKLMKILSYLCIFVVFTILACGVYALCTSGISGLPDLSVTNQYIADGKLLHANTFGIENPYLGGLSSAGLLIGSGFTWAATTGALCKSKKEAILSGVFSSLFYYATTAIVVYLILVSLSYTAGKEIPMLAVIQHFFPKLSGIYSVIIVLAIFSTVSSRLFLIASRYNRGNPKLNTAIIVGIAIFSVIGTAFIPFSRISNLVFSLMGAMGIFVCVVVLIRFFSMKHYDF